MPAASQWESDSALIERSLSAPDAFSLIFDRHFEAVFSYLARRAGRVRAEDLAASAFTVAFERRRRFRPEADSARPWLLGIATNLLRNDWRSERRALELIGRLGAPEVAEHSDEGDRSPRLGVLLAGLDPDQRDVLLLYAWEDLSYEEIASALSIPVGTVRSRLARARARLRAGLEPGTEGDTATREMRG